MKDISADDASRWRPGPSNSLTDVPGVRVGHHTLRGPGQLSGTTVVLAPDGGMVAGVDVRGGGPGTRETDLLDPRNQVERVHAVVLTGGSAFGLTAADGVTAALAESGVGFPVGPGIRVPIVPAAVVFDLGRAGSTEVPVTADTGRAAYRSAAGPSGAGPVAQGCVGAGTGAVAGGLKGGIGSASFVLPCGASVAALVVANPLGSTADPRTGELYGLRYCHPDEFPGAATPSPAEYRDAAPLLRAAMSAPGPAGGAAGLNTTIGVIATDVLLTKAQCAKVAGVAHDGMARAIRPVHSMFDGDTVFGLATGARPGPTVAGFHDVLTAAADCFARAVVHAVLAAETTRTPAGHWPSYPDLFPSAGLTRNSGLVRP